MAARNVGVPPGEMDDAQKVGVSLGETMVARIVGVSPGETEDMIKCVWIVSIV